MGLMSSVIAAYITLPFLVLENDNGGTGLEGSLNTIHNKHAKNTCIGHAKEALAITLNILKHF